MIIFYPLTYCNFHRTLHVQGPRVVEVGGVMGEGFMSEACFLTIASQNFA